MILVIDASAAVEYVLRTPRYAALQSVIEALDTQLHVPALCDLEFASALRTAVKLDRISPARAEEALTNYLLLDLVRHSHEDLLRRTFALRKNFTVQEAAYVALAEILEAPLLTADAALARAAARHTSIAVL